MLEDLVTAQGDCRLRWLVKLTVIKAGFFLTAGHAVVKK